jgi:hypothetical protein
LPSKAESSPTPSFRLRSLRLALGEAQESFEATWVGRAFLTAFILVTLVAIVTANFPESKLRHETSRVTEPYLNATGLDQVWSVFAPDPRRVSLALEARVRYADGTIGTCSPPRRGSLLGAYSDYRWAKWLENVVQDANRDQLWHDAALFVARERTDSGRRPVEITLIRRWQELRPPGSSGPDRGRWRSYAFYRLKLASNGGRT